MRVVCEGAKFGPNAFEGESGVGSPEKVIRLCLDGIGRCVPGPVVFCSRGVSTCHGEERGGAVVPFFPSSDPLGPM
jgi:hypothetical protein